MDNKPKSKAPAASYIDLPPSDDEYEEIQPQDAEALKDDRNAFTVVIGSRSSALDAAASENVPSRTSASKFIKYRSSQQSATGVEERIIRIVEMPVDPLEPPAFKYRSVPMASGSPAVTIMQSPPRRSVTVKDEQDWKIPPCISDWKNPKGYVIPLDKRLAADGRGLQEVQVNDNFSQLSEALYVAEQKAREAVAMRSKVQRELMMKEMDRKEQELRALAHKARSERTGVAPVSADKSMVGLYTLQS